MSVVSDNIVQVGSSPTTLNNLVIVPDGAGGVSIQQGVIGGGSNRTVLSVDGNGAVGVKGTTTNDNATAGNIGEFISSSVSGVSSPASGVVGDLTSVTLTAGDWDISSLTTFSIGTGVSILSGQSAILAVSGNSMTGVNQSNYGHLAPPIGDYNTCLTLPRVRVSLTATTTYYLKMTSTHTSGTPTFSGYISARRMR